MAPLFSFADDNKLPAGHRMPPPHVSDDVEKPGLEESMEDNEVSDAEWVWCENLFVLCLEVDVNTFLFLTWRVWNVCDELLFIFRLLNAERLSQQEGLLSSAR